MVRHHFEQEYNEKKVFTITDRPVYRPEQTVQWKFWIGQAKYDQASTDSPFAGQTFTVEIADPQGEKVLETQVVADKFGGLAGEYVLPKRPKLGVYQVYIKDHGGSSFRVEEYKKPSLKSPSRPQANRCSSARKSPPKSRRSITSARRSRRGW